MTTNRKKYQRNYVKKHYSAIRKYRTDWQNYDRAKKREEKAGKIIKEIHQGIELLMKMYLYKGRHNKKSGKK